MKLKLISVIAVLVLLVTGCAQTTAVTPAQSTAQKTSYITPKQSVEQYIKQTYEKNYAPFYNIKSLSLTTISESTKGTYTATTLLKATKTLKYSTVDSLPYIKGALSILNLQNYPFNQAQSQKVNILKQKNPQLTSNQIQRVITFLDKTYQELTKYIGSSYDSYLFLYVSVPLTASKTINTSSLKVMVEQPHYERVNLSSFKPLSTEDMTNEGKKDMQQVISGKIMPLSKTFYDPWKVAEYADKYTSNSVKYCPGTSVASDPSKWNNTKWPYSSSLCDSDCADFASQALNYAGLSISAGRWERLKDSSNGWPWTSSSGLRNYLLNQRKVVRLVEPWQIRVGGIITTNKGHTMIVVRNDTIETLTDAHTNDRFHEPVLPHSSWYYLNSW
ncbi:amidase domain-containing protein [Coprothermobacter platensis]|uniref:amidase domain-containing protein n=1 Tax=Coprothermobacter platensis TaxID=108819 RepID=UPI000369BF09|nr:amidase domain-containing protein [Coprothermobacter platensis]